MAMKNGQKEASLIQYESLDGIDWRPSAHCMVSDKTVTWADGHSKKLSHLERPQLYIEDGHPVALLCAADTLDSGGVRQTFNVQIPVTVTETSVNGHDGAKGPDDE